MTPPAPAADLAEELALAVVPWVLGCNLGLPGAVVVVVAVGVLAVVLGVGARYGEMMHSTGRKNSWAVCPTTFSTCVSFLAPGSSITMSLPWRVTLELDTPMPSTRRLMTCTASCRMLGVTRP